MSLALDNCKPGYPGAIRDAFGNFYGHFINGTPGDGIIDMSAETGNYIPAITAPDGTFRICIETAAPIVVILADGHEFTVTQAQADAYIGDWLPMNIKAVVRTGTTGTFSVGY
jgi:hypothetical protein